MAISLGVYPIFRHTHIYIYMIRCHIWWFFLLRQQPRVVAHDARWERRALEMVRGLSQTREPQFGQPGGWEKPRMIICIYIYTLW